LAARPGRLPLRSGIALAGLALATIPAALVQAILIPVWPRGANWMPPLWHRIACRILGVRVHVRGTPVSRGPCLFAANHISWLDIPVLASRLRISFIAKQEVAGWGVFGMLAKLQRTVFVARQRRHEAGRQRDLLARRFGAGDALVLFAEGTSSDGRTVLPFKTALFSVAEQTEKAGVPLPVQPVTIRYTQIDGRPLRRAYRPRIAWIGDMELVPHFLDVLKAGPIHAEIVFHPPLSLAAAGSRKLLARACEDLVRQGLHDRGLGSQ